MVQNIPDSTTICSSTICHSLLTIYMCVEQGCPFAVCRLTIACYITLRKWMFKNTANSTHTYKKEQDPERRSSTGHRVWRVMRTPYSLPFSHFFISPTTHSISFTLGMIVVFLFVLVCQKASAHRLPQGGYRRRIMLQNQGIGTHRTEGIKVLTQQQDIHNILGGRTSDFG